ncbi:unnamed protein product [Durusdinium trenchii]|uniref:Uncharacterized protein n=2 Tax=Durusdinium trenchii TaxID=1381693 RepID=A0ABP0Q947_9DINO
MVEDPEGEMDLFERLGLVESSQDAPQRSVSAPDDLSPSKRKKSNQSNVHKEKQDTSTCASLCNLLPCAAPVRVSSPELRAVPEESESPSPSRVNSPQGAESVVDAKDAFAGAVELVDETKQAGTVVPSAEPVDEADAFGPVCSEQDQQTCILTESVATHRPSWEPREDASESSQPLLCSEDGRIPPEHPNRVEDGESSVTSSRSGMEALTRLLGTAVGHWGDGWSETPQSRSRRSRHLAWGDGFSEMSRSETKESFDWDAMFSPQVRRGDDLV